jgi:2-keto-3-deoxy-L-rhamnonate aldolase RhmA
MNGNELAAALREGRRVYGTLVAAPAPEWPASVQQTGVDFVFIDTEHIALDRSQVSWMCRTYSALSLAPVVRIPSPDPCQAAMMLDAGAAGIVAPYVESAEESRRLVGAVKFAPLKGRRLAGVLDGKDALEAELGDYLADINRGRTAIVNIESIPAVERLDEILAVPGLDAVLIGPHDLSISLGIPLQYDHPQFIETVDAIITRARGAGVAAGMHAMFPGALPHEIRMAQAGANLFIHQADILAFRLAMKADLDTLRLALGDRPRPPEPSGGSTAV